MYLDDKSSLSIVSLMRIALSFSFCNFTRSDWLAPETGWSAAKDTSSAMDGMKLVSQSSKDAFFTHPIELAVIVCNNSSLGAYNFISILFKLPMDSFNSETLELISVTVSGMLS
nr:hypothetical protein Iba_chr13cCG5100 [Ipomoea batatas]